MGDPLVSRCGTSWLPGAGLQLGQVGLGFRESTGRGLGREGREVRRVCCVRGEGVEEGQGTGKVASLSALSIDPCGLVSDRVPELVLWVKGGYT